MKDKRDDVFDNIVAPIIEIDDDGENSADIEAEKLSNDEILSNEIDTPIISSDSILSTISDELIYEKDDETIEKKENNLENNNENKLEKEIQDTTLGKDDKILASNVEETRSDNGDKTFVSKDSINTKVKKSNSKLLVLIIVILTIILLCLVGFIIYKKQTNNTINENINIEPKQLALTPEEARESSLYNLLDVGEWGKSSKIMYENFNGNNYEDNLTNVPVSIKKIIRGDEAKTYIKNWFSSQKVFEYDEPEEGMEWILVNYSVDFRNIYFDNTSDEGTSKNLINAIIGADGGDLIFNNKKFAVSTINISKDEFVKENKIYNSEFIAVIPKECHKYVIRFGTSRDGYEAYFNGK